MKLLKTTLCLLMILFTQSKALAADITASVDTYKYTLKNNYLGISLNPTTTANKNNAFNSISEFGPSSICFPSAKVANYWDWKNGKIVKNIKDMPLEIKNLSNSTLTLGEFKNLLQSTSTEPIFILNMLTSDLNNQLDMLRTANKIGIPIKNIQLGSEFYLDKPLYLKKFPSIANYIKTANEWKTAIQNEFSTANVSFINAPSTFLYSANARGPKWNSIINSNIAPSDYISLSANASPGLFKDTFKINPNDYMSTLINKVRLNVIDASTIISNAIRSTNQISEDIQNIPLNANVWVTDYNMYDKYKVLDGKWINQLYAGVMTLNFLEEEKISKLIYTPNINDSNAIMKTISLSMKGKTSYQRIIFDDTPTISDSRNDEVFFSLTGYAFSNESVKEVVILNLSGSEMSINTSMLLKDTGKVYVQYYAKPMAKSSQIQKNKALCPTVLKLPAYSVTRIL